MSEPTWHRRPETLLEWQLRKSLEMVNLQKEVKRLRAIVETMQTPKHSARVIPFPEREQELPPAA
jgi:hypothetical protein